MDADSGKYVGKVQAPAFPEYADWLNTKKSYELSDFKGKIVLLDFWTYCCINCMHILPDLKRLEQKYPELVVIGVHSAKFKGEKTTDNIKEAIIRYDIEHPVINDHKFELWNRYGVSSWPTLVLVDPAGKVVGSVSGEGNYETLETYIEGILAHYKPLGQVNVKRFEFELEKYNKSNSLLSYPGKIAVDAKGKRLFISDSNNDRILICTDKGEILDVIGNGRPGREDGSFEESSFFRPQGVAYDAVKDKLYIADTENHLLRAADLKKRSLVTIAGTGRQANYRSEGGMGLQAALNSPWDLEVEGDNLRIAMAGPHQLWTMNLKSGKVAVLAGSGRENLEDGLASQAALAQPSGIALADGALYFADSETSSIRKLSNGKVETLIGSGLFDFGDKDGSWKYALLQHPLGVTVHKSKIYVADTYNNKVKEIDPLTEKIKTIAGNGKAALQDGAALDASLNEPNDMAWLGDKLFITDTNNDQVRIYDPATGKLSTLAFSGLEKLRALKVSKEEFGGKTKMYTATMLKAGLNTVNVKFELPEGYKVNQLAPNALEVFSADKDKAVIKTVKFNAEALTAEVAVDLEGKETELNFYLSLYYCDERDAAKCMFEELNLVQPVKTGTPAEQVKFNLGFLSGSSQ